MRIRGSTLVWATIACWVVFFVGVSYTHWYTASWLGTGTSHPGFGVGVGVGRLPGRVVDRVLHLAHIPHAHSTVAPPQSVQEPNKAHEEPLKAGELVSNAAGGLSDHLNKPVEAAKLQQLLKGVHTKQPSTPPPERVPPPPPPPPKDAGIKLPDKVMLFDDGRNMLVRLHATDYAWSKDGKQWNRLCTGSFHSDSEWRTESSCDPPSVFRKNGKVSKSLAVYPGRDFGREGPEWVEEETSGKGKFNFRELPYEMDNVLWLLGQAKERAKISPMAALKKMSPAPKYIPFKRRKRKLPDNLIWEGTIFVGIASYRDSKCHKTVWNMLTRAANPERVFFGIYQQHEAEDADCMEFKDTVCAKLTHLKKKQHIPQYDGTAVEAALVCRALNRISIVRVDSMAARGPTWARHMTQRQINPEAHDFYLQIDAHSTLVAAWDIECMRNWIMADHRTSGAKKGLPLTGANTGRAVLSTYPKDMDALSKFLLSWPSDRPAGANPSYRVTNLRDHGYDFQVRKTPDGKTLDPNLVYMPSSVTAICGLKWMSKDLSHMAKFDAATYITNPSKPVRTSFFAAGYAFLPIEAVQRVYYDPHTSYLFDGEEFSYTVRLFTHGFEFFAPCTDIIFHVYDNDRKQLKFWQVDWNHRFRLQKVSESRIRHIFGLPHLDDKPQPNLDEVEHYSLGKDRSLAEYETWIGYNVSAQKAPNICNKVRDGLPVPPLPH